MDFDVDASDIDLHMVQISSQAMSHINMMKDHDS